MSYTIVGGGVSGLAAAYYLRLLPTTRQVTLLESASRLGGWVQTTRNQDGALYEHGPRTLRPSGVAGANTLQIVDQLGLGNDVVAVYKDDPAAKNRYIYANQEIVKLPSGLSSTSLYLPREPFKRPLLAAILQELFVETEHHDDESIHSFVGRRFGEDVADYIIDPMVRGICAGDAREISAAAFVAGPLFKLEQETGGSAIKAMLKNALLRRNKAEPLAQSNLLTEARNDRWAVFSFANGMESIVEALAGHLRQKKVDIQLNAGVKEVQGANESKYKKPTVILDSGEAICSDHVFLSAPAHSVAKLTRSSLPTLSSELSKIPFVTTAVVNVEYEGPHVAPAEAFGFLVPSMAGASLPILGAVFDSCAFPAKNGNTIFTVMMGGRWFRTLFGDSPTLAHLENTAVHHLSRVIHVDKAPVRVTGKIQRNCIAQYVVGHLNRVANARAAASAAGGLSLIGSSYDGVGLNDAMFSARKAVDKIAAQSAQLQS